jgi:LysM repeat protein
MNTPNPLVPQGSLDRHSKGSSTVRIAVFTIVSIHAVFFAGLLMQGCRRDEAKLPITDPETIARPNQLPPLPTNQYYASEFEMPHSFETVQPPVMPVTYRESFPPLRTPELSIAPVSTTTYTIVKGDTLTKIAKAHNVPLGELSKANPDIDATRLKIGKQIQIPASASLSLPPSAGIGFAEPPRNPIPSVPIGNSYVVKSGDTLTQIARQHGTTIKAIQSANQMTSTRIAVGQKLKIPGTTNSSVNSAATQGVSQFSASAR